MPQTATTEGHAHLYEVGGTSTTVTLGHWHRIAKGQGVTGEAIDIGSEQVTPDSHRHLVDA